MNLGLLLLVAAHSGAGEPVARVDEIVIPAVAVTARAKEAAARGVKLDEKTLVQGLIDESLLALDAARSGLANGEEARALVREEVDRRLGSALLDREVGAGINPPEDLLRQMYHSTADVVRLSLVAVATEAEAKAVRARLDQGGELELEAVRSLDPVSAARRGDKGEMTRGQFPPDLAERLFGATPGTLLGPVPWGPGWAVVRVDARTIGDDAGFAARRGAIEKHARASMTSQARKHFLQAIRNKEKIEVDEKFLEGLDGRMEPTPAQAAHVLATIRGTPLRLADVLPSIRRVSAEQATVHRTGSTIAKQVVARIVDERILAALARDRGLEKATEVAPLLLRAEHAALARIAVERLIAALPPSTSQKDRQKAVDDRLVVLRKKASVTVDRARATTAIRAAR